MLLSVQSIEKRYGAEFVFSNISFTLEEGHRIALVGKNGAGKSTIMKIIAGKESPDSGATVLTEGKKISYLPQDINRDDERTGLEYIKEICSEEYKFLPILEGLGVPQDIASRKLTDMSGGQQTKILLTRFILEPSDILLLDEPTNNLDIPSLLWLEKFLSTSKKAMIIISHDLVFLDNIANRVFELKDGDLNIERGRYSDYIDRKKKLFEREKKEYAAYLSKLESLENLKRDFQKKGESIDKTKAKDGDKLAAGSRRDKASNSQKGAGIADKKIKRLDKVEKPFEEEVFKINLDARNIAGNIEISAEDVVAGYEDGIKIGPTSFKLKLGERLCLMGMNGAGKSTILKTIIGDLSPIEGEVNVTEGISFGDLMQQHERADRNEKALDFFIKQTGSDKEKGIHSLKTFGFSEQMINQSISGLSSGMRARLLFSIFNSLGVNVLVLDEPTNHLDIEAVEALKNMLQSYKGIVLLVSHNRWFLEDLKIDFYYDVADSEFNRIKDFDKYVEGIKERADRMVGKLRHIIS